MNELQLKLARRRNLNGEGTSNEVSNNNNSIYSTNSTSSTSLNNANASNDNFLTNFTLKRNDSNNLVSNKLSTNVKKTNEITKPTSDDLNKSIVVENTDINATEVSSTNKDEGIVKTNDIDILIVPITNPTNIIETLPDINDSTKLCDSLPKLIEPSSKEIDEFVIHESNTEIIQISELDSNSNKTQINNETFLSSTTTSDIQNVDALVVIPSSEKMEQICSHIEIISSSKIEESTTNTSNTNTTRLEDLSMFTPPIPNPPSHAVISSNTSVRVSSTEIKDINNDYSHIIDNNRNEKNITTLLNNIDHNNCNRSYEDLLQENENLKHENEQLKKEITRQQGIIDSFVNKEINSTNNNQSNQISIQSINTTTNSNASNNIHVTALVNSTTTVASSNTMKRYSSLRYGFTGTDNESVEDLFDQEHDDQNDLLAPYNNNSYNNSNGNIHDSPATIRRRIQLVHNKSINYDKQFKDLVSDDVDNSDLSETFRINTIDNNFLSNNNNSSNNSNNVYNNVEDINLDVLLQSVTGLTDSAIKSKSSIPIKWSHTARSLVNEKELIKSFMTTSTIDNNNSSSSSKVNNNQSESVIIDKAINSMEYSEFLNKFAQCLDLVNFTRDFITSILGPEGDGIAPKKPKKLPYVFYGLHKLAERCRSFFDQMQEMFTSYDAFKAENEERITSARDCFEQYVLGRIAEFAFKTINTPKEDEQLMNRMKILSFLTPDTLDIKPGLFNEEILGQAMDELKKINSFKTPGDKVNCIVKCATVIFRLLSNYSKNPANKDDSGPAGADDFLPLFIWVVLKSNIPKLYSNCEYIQAFLNPTRLMGQSGYCLINLRSAIEFINYISAESLRIDPNEFEAKYAEAERELNGGF